MPTKPNASVRLRDARDVYLLVGECRSVANEGLAWRRHLVTQIRRLFAADLCYLADNQFVGQPGAPQGWVRPLSIIDDWEQDDFRPMFWQYVRRGRLEDNPMRTLFERRSPRVQVATRRDLVSDQNWYSSPFCRDYLIPAGYDDFVVGVIHGPDDFVQKLFVQRRVKRDPFSPRTVRLLKMVLLELASRQPHELRGIDDSEIAKLPRRMLQVLACLLAGNTVKETAQMLGVSAHTVQEHVKRLYKRSGATNRAQLADCYRDVAPLVMGMSPDEIPDHQQQVQAATRQPWPTEAIPSIDE